MTSRCQYFGGLIYRVAHMGTASARVMPPVNVLNRHSYHGVNRHQRGYMSGSFLTKTAVKSRMLAFLMKTNIQRSKPGTSKTHNGLFLNVLFRKVCVCSL